MPQIQCPKLQFCAGQVTRGENDPLALKRMAERMFYIYLKNIHTDVHFEAVSCRTYPTIRVFDAYPTSINTRVSVSRPLLPSGPPCGIAAFSSVNGSVIYIVESSVRHTKKRNIKEGLHPTSPHSTIKTIHDLIFSQSQRQTLPHNS